MAYSWVTSLASTRSNIFLSNRFQMSFCYIFIIALSATYAKSMNKNVGGAVVGFLFLVSDEMLDITIALLPF